MATGTPSAFRQDADATLDYGADWTAWLAANETITTSDWIIDPTDLVKGATDQAAGKTTVWLSGGSPGKIYTVTNRVTTSGGRTDDLTFEMRII